METNNHYVYIIRCNDESLYTGYTTDVKRRVKEHNTGNGAKYTRGRTPVTLEYVGMFDSQGDAMSREYEIKQLKKEEKEKLCGENRQVKISFL